MHTTLITITVIIAVLGALYILARRQMKNIPVVADSEPGSLQYVVLRGQIKRPVMGKILSALTVEKSAGKGTLTLILDKTLTTLPSEEGYILTCHRQWGRNSIHR